MSSIAHLQRCCTAVGLVVLVTAGCSGDKSDGPGSLMYTGSAVDPQGDGGTVDLVSATVTISDDSVTLKAVFAPGSLATQSTTATFLIDADLSATTGDLTLDPAIGADYWIIASQAVPQPGINTYANGHWSILNIAGRLTFGQESITATIPLAMLGGDDGTVRFKVRGSYVDTTLNSVVYEDWLTDAGELAVSVK